MTEPKPDDTVVLADLSPDAQARLISVLTDQFGAGQLLWQPVTDDRIRCLWLSATTQFLTQNTDGKILATDATGNISFVKLANNHKLTMDPITTEHLPTVVAEAGEPA